MDDLFGVFLCLPRLQIGFVHEIQEIIKIDTFYCLSDIALELAIQILIDPFAHSISEFLNALSLILENKKDVGGIYEIMKLEQDRLFFERVVIIQIFD